METAHAPNRQSDILPLINQLKFDPVKGETAERAYNSSANMTTSALVSPTTMYPGPPPPYYSNTTPTSSHPISGLISPPESRRTSDDQDQPNIPHQQRQSLPSILEALGAPPSVSAPPYQQQPSAAAPAPMPNPFSAPSNPLPRSQPLEPPSSNLQRTSPPQPIHFQHRSYIRNESAPSNLPPPQNPYAEPSRHQSMPSIHSSQPPPQHRMQSAYVEQQRYENDPRSFDSGNRMNGYPPQQQQQPNHYGGYQPSQMTMAPAPYPNQYPPQARPYQNSRYGLEHAEEHSKYGEPASARKTYAPVVKRHLDTFEIEISLAEISHSSSELVQFSAHYHRLAQDTQRSAQTPERMPTLSEVDNMLQLSEKQINALQRMRVAVMEQQHIQADQMARDQGKGIDYDGDEGSMYSEDMKNNGYGGSDAKKRRGRAAPPGRCHSCNRAETPEWRRGPDGARTLCNACGLHYAKLTRKMGGSNKNNGLGGVSSSLRPKSMGSNSPL